MFINQGIRSPVPHRNAFGHGDIFFSLETASVKTPYSFLHKRDHLLTNLSSILTLPKSILPKSI